jgi:hypothetical protein
MGDYEVEVVLVEEAEDVLGGGEGEGGYTLAGGMCMTCNIPNCMGCSANNVCSACSVLCYLKCNVLRALCFMLLALCYVLCVMCYVLCATCFVL